MRHRAIIAAAILCLSACSDSGARLGAGDFVDVSTTAIGLSNDYGELNPIIPSEPASAVVVGLGLKYGARVLLIDQFGWEPDEANRTVEAFGWFGGCHNLAYFAAASHPLGFVAGAGCAWLFWQNT